LGLTEDALGGAIEDIIKHGTTATADYIPGHCLHGFSGFPGAIRTGTRLVRFARD